MKKLLILLLILPFCIAGCRKDPRAKPGDEVEANTFPQGYVIQGKMKSNIGAYGGREMPYIMVFGANGKVRFVNTEGESQLDYSVSGDKLLLNDNGFFNIKDNAITDWVIAGINITEAELLKAPEANQLKDKTFAGSYYSVKFGLTIQTAIKFDATADKLSFPNEEGQEQYDYTPVGNTAGFKATNEYREFFMYHNGKLERTSYSDLNGLMIGTFNPE